MFQESAIAAGRSKFSGTFRKAMILALRVALILVLVGGGWLVYRELPATSSSVQENIPTTNLQIVLHQPDNGGPALDVPVNLYPVDVVAVRHEFFTEPRAGKRFEDFLKERMKGRSPVNTRLDKEGRGSITLAPGTWWLHATIGGDEQLEWRLPVTVIGAKQIVELTPQNAYTRSKSF
jgi:hypothetical protein